MRTPVGSSGCTLGWGLGAGSTTLREVGSLLGYLTARGTVLSPGEGGPQWGGGVSRRNKSAVGTPEWSHLLKRRLIPQGCIRREGTSEAAPEAVG